MKILLSVLFLLFHQFAFAQADIQTIDLMRAQTKPEGVPYFLKLVKFEPIEKQKIGEVVPKGKKNVVQLAFPIELENHVIGFIQNAFNGQKAGTPIALHIKQMGIYPTVVGQVAASDTFKYECEFRGYYDGQWQALYNFNAKNAVGVFENPVQAVENYMARALTTSIQKFTNAFEKNKDWNILKKANSIAVSATVKHNKFKTTNDSLACEKNTKLQEAMYKTMDKNMDVIGQSRFILTYKAEATETKNTIKLAIETFAFFDKNRSWLAKNNANRAAWILQQQGHYDLCTLYGLKLNKAMNEFPYSMGEYKSEMNKVYNDVYAEYTKIRKQYEDETKSDHLALAKWQQKIAAMMKQAL